MTIVYLDPVFPELKELIDSMNKIGMKLYFAVDYSGEQLNEIIANMTYLIVATAPVRADLIEQAKKLKHIQKTGIGVDNIDLEAARRQGITVSNTPGANATGVAELSVLLMLALYRKLPILNTSMKVGEWQMWEHRLSSYELEGKTHGLFGFGRIGQETAKRSKAFGTRILYHDVKRADLKTEKEVDAIFVTKEELLKEADIVSLHLPYLPETAHFIDEYELNLMKKTAILINVSRGGTVNEAALAQALRNGDISGAGIDVWSTEPPAKNHPLLGLEQVIATPHIGAGTKDTLKRVLKMSFDNIQEIQAGKAPTYLV